MGFLPNGDLIIVSVDKKLKEYKIYLYPFKNKPTANSTLWESQIYDIEIPENLKSEVINCWVDQTKLFLVLGSRSMIQWNLLTMSFDMQYFFGCESYIDYIVTNKNQTILALKFGYKGIGIFSMETGIRISRYEG